MKKFLSAILAGAILCTSAVALTACGGSTSTSTVSIKSADDLKGKAIGVQLGTTGDIVYASDYEKDGSKIERFSKGSDAVVALSSGKVDAVIIDGEPAKEFVKANEGLKILEDSFEKEDYAICIAKEKKDLLDKFNEALKTLKADGTLDKIVSNYVGDETKGKNAYESPKDIKYPNGELHMATNAAFPPYEFVENGEVVGIDAMAAKAICDKLGYKLVIDDMEFDSIITAVQSGKADFGMAGMTVTDERLKSINFTDSYATSTQVIIVKE